MGEKNMTIQAINFSDKLRLISERWSPKIIAQMNDYHFKLAKVQGEFIWHAHAETDEVFIVLDGSLRIELRGDSLTLASGEMAVIPKGVEHKPVAVEPASILLVEPAGTLNTGDAGGELTITGDVWI
jgi:mannose-6-phosphate isomerase-like protein (cupin superfamily)